MTARSDWSINFDHSAGSWIGPFRARKSTFCKKSLKYLIRFFCFWNDFRTNWGPNNTAKVGYGTVRYSFVQCMISFYLLRWIWEKFYISRFNISLFKANNLELEKCSRCFSVFIFYVEYVRFDQLSENRRRFRTLSNIYDGAFLQK